MSQYATTADLVTYGINAIAIQQIPTIDQTNQLVAASELIDSYIRGRYALPLLAPFDVALTMNCAYIASYLLMSVRGYRPTQGSDDTLRENYKNAIKWCEGVQRQAIHPLVVQSTPPLPNTYELPQVRTAVPRGWSGPTRFGRPEGVG